MLFQSCVSNIIIIFSGFAGINGKSDIVTVFNLVVYFLYFVNSFSRDKRFTL